MSQAIIVRCGGLASDLSPLAGEDGRLKVADNVVIDRPGVARPRPGLPAGETHDADSRRPRSFGFLSDSAPYVSESAGDGTDYQIRLYSSASPLTVPTGGAEPLARFDSWTQFANARRNLYWTSKIGPCKVSSVVQTAAVQAGMHEAPSAQMTAVSLGAVAVPDGQARAYRVCFVKRDANGLVTRSAPSPWQSYENTTGVTRDVDLSVPLPTYALAGDAVELYATVTVPNTDTPSDMMYLSKRQTVTSGDVSAGVVTVRDSRTNDQLGSELYTNPTREGLLKSNYRPPASGALAQWNECMWFGRCVGPWTSVIEFVSVSGGVTSSIESSLQVFEATGTISAGSSTISGLADTSSITIGQLVSDGGVPGSTGGRIPVGAVVTGKTSTTVSISIAATGTGTFAGIYYHDRIVVGGDTYYAGADTGVSGGYYRFGVSTPILAARGLAYVITLRKSGFYAYAVEDPFTPTDSYGNATSGAIVIRSVALDASQFTVTSNRLGALSYETSDGSAILVDRDDRPNALFYSKPGEPEHVPEINFLTIGSEDAPILALAPLSAALMVFKTDGLYRVTGSAPDGWSVDLIDGVLRPLRAECVDVAGEFAVVWAQNGVFLVDEGGLRNVSFGAITDQLLAGSRRVINDNSTTGAWVASWVREGLVLVGVPDAEGAGNATEIYCYSLTTGAWTRWILSLYCAKEARKTGELYAANARLLDWEVSNFRSDWQPENGFTGYDASYSVAWTYDATVPSIVVTKTDAARWVPKVCDWVNGASEGGGEYRRIVAVEDTGSEYTLTLDAPFSGSPEGGEVFEGIESVIQWMALTAGSPAVDAIWRDIQVAYDWSRWTGSVGGLVAMMEIGGQTNRTEAVSQVEWTAPRAATPSDMARVTPSQEIARGAHFYPRVSTCEIGLDWRILGVSVSFETASERTRR